MDECKLNVSFKTTVRTTSTQSWFFCFSVCDSDGRGGVGRLSQSSGGDADEERGPAGAAVCAEAAAERAGNTVARVAANLRSAQDTGNSSTSLYQLQLSARSFPVSVLNNETESHGVCSRQQETDFSSVFYVWVTFHVLAAIGSLSNLQLMLMLNGWMKTEEQTSG